MTELYTQHLVNLMAKENLQMKISSSVDVAAIDLSSRTILVNSFLNAFSSNVLAFERMLCHEVGHALFTQKTDWEYITKKFDKQLANVFEDIRIENLLKLKFPGLRKLFSTGFYELDKIMGEKFNLSATKSLTAESHLIDKINVYFKSNYLHPINFSEKEMAFIQKLKEFTEFSQSEQLIKEFITLCLGEKKEEKGKEGTTKSSEPGESNDQGDSETEGDQQISENKNTELSEFDANDLNEFNVELAKTTIYKDGILEDMYKKNQDRTPNRGTNTLEELDQTTPNIITNDQFKSFVKERMPKTFDWVDEIYKDNDSTTRSADLLYTEFERQKNAKNFRDQHQVKTGELNLNKLSQFKTSSRLFKHAVIKPNQKNHEVIVLLDWSSSIRANLVDLIKESIVIVKFCKKANIPCSVYAFMDNNSIRFVSKAVTGVETTQSSFLVEVLSTVSSSLLDDCKELLFLGTAVSFKFYRTEVHRELYNLCLGRTPLHYALFNLPSMLKHKVANNKRICLTVISDGRSDRLRLTKKGDSSTITSGTTVIDPLTKSIINLNDRNEFLFSRLKKAFPTLSILTIHIADTLNNCVSNNGFLPENNKVYQDCYDKIKRNNTFFGTLDHFDHLIIKTEGDKTKRIKNPLKQVLAQDNHTMSKYIYKQIASSFS